MKTCGGKGWSFLWLKSTVFHRLKAQNRCRGCWIHVALLLMAACFFLSLVIPCPFCAPACQTSAGNGPAVTTLPAVRLSSKPPLIPSQISELKLALEGNNAFTPSQVTVPETPTFYSLLSVNKLTFYLCVYLLTLTSTPHQCLPFSIEVL